MERYDSYKDSGIQWLGQIPEHWEIRRLKSLFNQRVESYSTHEKLEVLSLLKDVGVIPYTEKGNVGNKSKEDYSSYHIARKGDIVMNSMNVIIGSVDITDYDGYISPAYYAIYAKRGVCSKYFNFIFHTKACQKHMRSLANGILEIRLRLSTTNLFGMYYPLPPLSEQEGIVAYLDRETQKIDTFISSKQKEIQLLNELKQAEIANTVTRGLNPNVPMKDSGITWLGQVPEHWETIPFKNVFTLEKGLPITKADLIENGEKVISYGQIHSKLNKTTTVVPDLYRFVSSSFIETNPGCIVHNGDFIFADTSEDVEGSGNFIRVDTDELVFAGYHTIIARCKMNQYSHYLAYLCCADSWRSQIRSLVHGVKVFSINRPILNKAKFLLPPLPEQKEIVEYLDRKCANIDKMISNIEQEITQLKEYKQRLIADAVTGQIKVC